MNNLLKKSEHIEDMGKGLMVIQDKSGYTFTTDSVLLSNFVKCKRKDEVLELCSGSGVISFLVHQKFYPKNVTGVEIQTRLCDMANRSAHLNNLQHKIKFINISLQEAPKVLNKEYDVLICNPPYNKKINGKSENSEIAIARSEVEMTLEDLLRAAYKLLKYGGKFYLIHRADRLDEAILLMHKHNLTPKVLQLIQPKIDTEPHLFLVECIKNGALGLRVLPNLVIDN